MKATHGSVYRAFDVDGALLYVGMSSDPRGRVRAHATRTSWWSLVARVEVDPRLPLADAFRSECDQITKLAPRFNRNGGVAQYYGHVELDSEALRSMYERGMTIEQIALEVGTVPNAVRAQLIAAGTAMRPPGQRVGTVPKPRTDAKPRSTGAVVHVAFKGSRGVHRRRGGRVAA